MMSISRVLLFLSLFFLIICSLCGLSFSLESHPTVNDLLKRTEASYLKMHAFSAEFQQSVTSQTTGGTISEASGRLYYQKPKKMRWEYDKPEPQVFVANQEIAWLYVPSEKQASLVDSQKIFSHPLAQTFFDGVGELKKHYEVTLDLRQSTDESMVLKLVPKQEDPEIKLLFLTIELPGYVVKAIEIHNSLGNINRISLESTKVATNLEGRLFQFDLSSDTTILDSEGRILNHAEIETLKQKLLSNPDRKL